MTNRGRKRKGSNFSLQDEPITQPPIVMAVDDHPYTHAQFDKQNSGNTYVADKIKEVNQSNLNLPHERLMQPPRVMAADGHPYTHAQIDKQNRGDTYVVGKSQMINQSNFNLHHEQLVQPRIITVDEPPQSARDRFNMLNHGETIMTTGSGTQFGRTHHGYRNTQKAPSVRIDHHQRHELRNTRYVGNNGSTQKGVTNNRSNNGLREDSIVENELMDGSYEEHEQGSEAERGSTKTESRGPTYMQKVWGRPANLPRFPVEYNEFGQPIGGEISKLCHFLGSIARNGKYCPLDVTDWRAMPRKNKIEMLDVIKLRFHVPIIAKKWIFSSLGHKWRNWKHFLKTRYWVPNIPVEHLLDERDERVLIDQWVKILTHWNKEEAKKASKKNKDAREKRIMDQATGKTSFAQTREILRKKLGRPPTRVELFCACYISKKREPNKAALSKLSEMQELSNQLPEGSEDPIDRNDIFAQTMGQDRPGYVRMLGQGISPSDLWGEVPRNKSNCLLMAQESRIAHLESILAQQRYDTSQGELGQQTTFGSPSDQLATTRPILVGGFVSLKSLFDPTKVVAKGYIHNTNPSTEVGGQVLGKNWCEVNVKVILEPEEQLIRPYDNLRKLEDTLGEMIAWPCHLVTPTED